VKTLIILNPNAGSGRAGKLWSKIEPMLWEELGELVVAVTQNPDEVARHLESARAANLTRVIAIGGDGTNHALINELARINRLYPDGPHMTFGSLPIGTGQDWARTIGVPFTPAEAVRWIKDAHPVPLDLGLVTLSDGETLHFLNIASAGISGVIATQVNQLKRRRPWTFYVSTLEALISYKPPRVKVKLDGQDWYEGKTYAVVVANGQNFGHGMHIAPNAAYNDGLFDVVLFEGIPRLEAMVAFNSVYSGAHLKRSDVHVGRARMVEIDPEGGPMPVELDGESRAGPAVKFEVMPAALSVLIKDKIPTASQQNMRHE